MKLIYVCSAYEGAEHQYKAAVGYGRYVKSLGGVPIIPHIMYHGIYDDKEYEEKQTFISLAGQFMEMCSEVWVFGKQRTFKMKEELALAAKLGKEIKNIAPIITANDDLAVIARDYELTTGNFMNGAIGNDIIFYLECGISKEVISYAITEQARRNAGWQYGKKILERCREQKIKTVNDLNRAVKKKAEEKIQGRSYNLEAFEKKLNDD